MKLAMLLSMLQLLANAGTPLMWLTLGQLALGNIAIGLVEAMVIGIWTRRSSARLLWAIPINYLSAFLGLFAIPLLSALLTPVILRDEPLMHLQAYLAAMLLGTFLLSVIVEWPLYRWVLKPSVPWRQTILPVIASQVVSYALLVVFYLGAISLPSHSRVQPVHLAAIAQHTPATVYFITAEGDAVCRIRSDGTGRQTLTPVDLRGKYARLRLEPKKGERQLQLTLDIENARQTILEIPLPQSSPPEWLDNYPGQTLEWRSQAQRDPQISVGFWAPDGLRVGEWDTPGFYRVAVETPFTWWGPGSASVLPGGQVIYGLHDWLMLFDPATRQMATIARGQSPIAIPDATPSTRPVSLSAPRE